MKIGTNEKHIIAAMLVSFLVGLYCATHQFSWDDLWLFGMSVTFCCLEWQQQNDHYHQLESGTLLDC